MRTAILYVSIHHGNTEKIAREIARVLDAELLNVGKANEETIKNNDLIGFGKKAKEFAEKLKITFQSLK